MMTCFPLLYPNSLTDDCGRVTFKLIKDWIVWVHLSKPSGTTQHGLCTRGLAGTESAPPVQRSPGGAVQQGWGQRQEISLGRRSAPEHRHSYSVPVSLWVFLVCCSMCECHLQLPFKGSRARCQSLSEENIDREK